MGVDLRRLLYRSTALDTFDMIDSLVLDELTADGHDGGLRKKQKTIINQLHGRIEAEGSSKDDSEYHGKSGAQNMQPPVYITEDEEGNFPGLGPPMTG